MPGYELKRCCKYQEFFPNFSNLIRLQRKITTIGRQVSNNIVLTHTYISRKQAEITVEDNNLSIKNVSSGGVIEIINRSTAEKVEVHPQKSQTLLPNHIIKFDRDGTVEHGYFYLLRESNYSDEPVESSIQEPIKQRNELTTPQKRKFNDSTPLSASSSSKKSPSTEKNSSKSISPPKPNSQGGDEIIKLLTCAICLEILIPPTASLSCGHTFCAFCIDNWASKTKACPRCNVSFTESHFPRNFDLESMIETYLSTKEKSFQDDYEEAKKERSDEIERKKAESGKVKEVPKEDPNLNNFEAFYSLSLNTDGTTDQENTDPCPNTRTRTRRRKKTQIIGERRKSSRLKNR